MVSALRLLARFPLAWLHALGAAMGRLVYLASPRYAARLKENLSRSGIYADDASLKQGLRAAVTEIGKAVAEVPKIWFDDFDRTLRLVDCHTWSVIDEAKRDGRGIIFLTPHLGCFELIAPCIATRVPLTALYRPPHQRWLEPLMLAGRNKRNVTISPANLRGVRTLYKTLQRGDAVGLLPDQAPQFGEGVWADFFGRPAYTMTLVRRLQKQTGAAVIFVTAERLPRSAGYLLRYERHEGELDEAAMNREIERLVRRMPSQYLWSYNRYKSPRGVEQPAQVTQT